MRKIILALCLFAVPLQAQMKVDSTSYNRQYGLTARWKKIYAAPDSQYFQWGFNYGGPGSVAKLTLTRTDTLRTFYPSLPLDKWSIWSCVNARSGGVWKNSCNSFSRPAVGQIIHDTVYIKIYGVAQWVFPRDTVKYAKQLASCDRAKASIDSISGLLKLGCIISGTTTQATLQMCMVSILSDSSVVWAKQSKAVCPDSIPKKKYGSRWHPELPVDTTLVFSLAGASWH